VWVPWELSDVPLSRTSHGGEMVARLAPGVSAEAATRDIDRLFARLASEHPADFDAIGATVTPLQASLTQSARAPLTLLMVASLLLMLTACTNLAGAMLARGTARAGELAVRSALGATRSRLVRQLVTECSILAIAGGLLGLILGRLMLRIFSVVAPETVGLGGVQLDARVIAFTAGVVALTAIAFGWAPAMRLSDGQGAKLLREGGRGTSRLRAWNVLVAGEVALAVMLLAGSALLIRSFAHVMQQRLGFEPAGVTSAAVNLPSATYGSRGPLVPVFHERILGALASTPGIEAAGFMNVAPLGGNGLSGSLEIEGKPLEPRRDSNGYALYRVVGGDAFRALGTPLIAGRLFAPTDDATAPRVVIVNETFAKTAWAGDDPIGKRVRPVGMEGYDEPWHTVIGVVGDARSGSPIDRYRDTYYFDHRQRPPGRAQSVTYLVRSALPPSTVSATLRDVVRAVDPDVPLEVRAMDEVVRGTLSDRRFTMLVLTAFAALALLLAVIGIFAVVSYSVAQRTREIGVRLALGSTPARVRTMVIADALHAVVPGLLLGAALTMASAGVLRTMLYGVSPFDPLALVGAVVLLTIAALASSLIPAVRSTRVDPMLAIRGP
jgi:predicted permease